MKQIFGPFSKRCPDIFCARCCEDPDLVRGNFEYEYVITEPDVSAPVLLIDRLKEDARG